MRWVSLGVLSIGLLLTGLDTAIITIAVPKLTRGLDANFTELQWILDAYVLAFASLQLGAGVLGDRLGRRGVLTVGLIIFGLGSAGAAFASTPGQLIAMRVVMGVGAALILPTTLSLILNIFPPEEHQRAIAAWSGAAGVGIPLGPLLGGWLLSHFWWGSVFLINLPVVFIALLAGHFLVPTSRSPSKAPFDVIGVLLSIVGLAVLLYGIIEAPNNGWISITTLGCFLLGIALLTCFAFWERQTEHPSLDVRIFNQRSLSIDAVTISLAMFALYGVGYFFNQYLQFTLSYTPFQAGLRTAPVALGLMLGAPASVPLTKRIGTRAELCLGLGVIAVAWGLMTLLQPDTGVLFVILIMLIEGVGVGLSLAPATTSVMSALPPSRAGVGAAVNTVTRETGGALGIAVLGSILTWQFRANIIRWAEDHGVSGSTQSAIKKSIGSALQTAGRAEPKAGATLVHASNTAFVDAIHVTAGVATGALLVGIALCAAFYPRRSDESALSVTVRTD